MTAFYCEKDDTIQDTLIYYDMLKGTMHNSCICTLKRWKR